MAYEAVNSSNDLAWMKAFFRKGIKNLKYVETET